MGVSFYWQTEQIKRGRLRKVLREFQEEEKTKIKHAKKESFLFIRRPSNIG